MAYYDSKPQTFEAVGNGSFLYRWNIQEEASESAEQTSGAEAESVSHYSCEEVTVWQPLTSNKVTEAAITSKWDANYEQKLINEYNAAQLGFYGETTSEEAQARIKAYTDYLSERAALKAQIDADCKLYGIK